MKDREDPIIHLKDIERVYYTEEVETHALSGIDLDVRRGEFVSISGPSGSGKTTLLSILGLLDAPSRGVYHLDGETMTGLSTAERARIRCRKLGFVFQSFNLIGDLTVAENVELPLSYQGVVPADRRRRVTEALETVGMSHRRGHFPAQLSGGQQQRVAVARAIVGRPVLLLADEPTGNLDTANGENVVRLLQELNDDGTTICMVTHNPDYAALAQRDIHLLDGRIVDELRPRPLEAVR